MTDVQTMMVYNDLTVTQVRDYIILLKLDLYQIASMDSDNKLFFRL